MLARHRTVQSGQTDGRAPREPGCPLGLVALTAGLFMACGGDPPAPPPGPAPIEGAYALVMGTQSNLIPLGPGQAQVLCRPKPALKELELDARPQSAADAGKHLRFVLKEFGGPGRYEIEYSPGAEHKVEVSFPPRPGDTRAFKYVFFEYLRTDLRATYRSHCDFEIAVEELVDRTAIKGTLSCGALWADFSSIDYVSQPLNNFADLVARFECEHAS